MASILNVDKIRATGSTTDGLVVDSSGRVTLPAIPCFTGRLTTSNSVDTSNPYTTTGTIKYDDIEVNQGSCYNASTGLFTAPVAGIYFAIVHHLTNSTASTDASVEIEKNNSSIANAYASPNGEFVNLTCQTLISLSVNDTLNTNLSSGDLYLSSSGHHGMFTVKLVG
tara:strand:- start:140 stop:643 length:504 start_codon:yes stop_codon:yes gene_type:complete